MSCQKNQEILPFNLKTNFSFTGKKQAPTHSRSRARRIEGGIGAGLPRRAPGTRALGAEQHRARGSRNPVLQPGAQGRQSDLHGAAEKTGHQESVW